MMEEDALLLEKIQPQYPYTKAEVKWMTAHEMAVTVEDILARRIRLLFLDAKAAIAAAPVVANIMAKEMNKGDAWAHQQVTDFILLARRYLISNDEFE